MKTTQIEIVDSLSGITNIAESTYRNEVPGFQIELDFARNVGVPAVMDCIERGSKQALGQEIPFTHLPSLWNEPGQYASHIDASFRGLSIHANVQGEGIVQLAHLLDGTQPGRSGVQTYTGDFHGDRRSYSGGGITEACKDVAHGQVYEGEFKNGQLTVFSQGNIPDLLPAIHYFRRTSGGNWWTRYASSFEDTDLDKARLDDHAEQFRLNLSHSEFYKLFSDKRTLDYYAKNPERLEGTDPASLTESGLTAKQIQAKIRKHPGRNIISLGIDDEVGIRFKKIGAPRRVAGDLLAGIIKLPQKLKRNR